MHIRSRFSIAATFLVLFAAPADSADLPTYEEICAAYQQNISGMLPFSVEWQFIEQELTASIETDAVYAGLIKATVARDDYPGQDKEVIKGQDAVYDRGLSEQAREARLKPRRSRHFLWTDGRKMQYRTPEKREDISLDGSEMTSAESLLSSWLPVRIFSYVPDREPKLRVWTGFGSDGKTPFGLVGSKELSQLRGRVRFPPLGAIHSEWADHFRLSELDKWTSSDLSEGLQKSEVGEPIRGEETILLRHASGGKPGTSVGRMAIWVAHRKGFLPLRIERSYSGGPLSLEVTEEYPSRVYETLEIETIETCGSGYYPRKTKTTKFGPDPKWRSENIGKDPTSLPKVPVLMVPVKTIEEEFLRIEPGRLLDEESLALAFPVGTRFQDQDTKQWYLEGTPKEEFDRQLVAELTAGDYTAKPRSAPTMKRGQFGMFLWINVGVVIALAVIYSRFRHKAKP